MTEATTSVAYEVDIVFCIDVTGSMAPVITSVKQGALSFHERLASVLARRDIATARTRIRVIAYRDFGADRHDVIEQTPFLELPADAEAFEAFMAGLVAKGGGDYPESGLEALALAVHSPWTQDPETPDSRLRHFIVVFTDASAHPLGKHTPRAEQFGPKPAAAQPARRPERRSLFSRRAAPQPTPPEPQPSDSDRPPAPVVPMEFPRTLAELQAQWGSPDGNGAVMNAVMNQDAKRLLIFAPDEEPWEDIADTWDKAMHVRSQAGTGLADVALDEVISTIARTA